MKNTTSIPLAALFAALLASAPSLPLNAAESKEPPRPLVQIALLLDTSNSMDGLIEQAKGQLWKIVNEFINARQNGRRPDLEVALFEYGKSSLSREEGYIRLIQRLTHDLDKISEELFALRTNGGDEYCGWVIREAVEKLAWSKSPDDFKAIFIAGNEPFTQGPVDYAKSCKAAIERGIIVNTIHCGGQAEGISTKWRDGALLAEGKYMVIDHNRAVVHFEAPQDKEIARLGVELNKTYLAFGRTGEAGALRQTAQDANSVSLAAQGSLLNRAVFKASPQYRNDTWDLVDACRNGKVKLAELKPDELPAELRNMTAAEQHAFVQEKTKVREEVQNKINRLNAERSKYIAEQTKQRAGADTLDAVVTAAIREQAVKKNFRFD
ncbi:MAG: VWA domain-containing protein [Verrucomicrobia bacterium]|nr:VWA domain-containing protein [Verrucomicrobiota bacterium]